MFSRLEDLTPDDLIHIREKEKLNLDNQIYEVRFTNENEPVLMCYVSNAQNRLIQARLTKLWINQLAQQELANLADIEKENSSLKLNVVFLGLGTGGERSQREIAAAEIWHQNALVIQQSFDKAIRRMQEPLDAEQSRLETEVTRLSDLDEPTREDKKALLRIKAEIENLVIKQNKLNKNITRLKSEFAALCHLISYCSDEGMITTFTLRLTNFLDFVVRYSESSMGVEEIGEFNTMLNTQSEFLKHFGPEEVTACAALFDPPISDRARDYGIIPPTSDLLRNELRQLLTDPTKSWNEIERAIQRLRVEQEILLSNKIRQIQFGRYVEKLIKEKFTLPAPGKYSSGLNEKSGLTYFTPETFSRIISLQKIRDQLLDPEQDLTEEQIEVLGAKFSHHYKRVETESLAILEKQKQSFFPTLAATNQPELDEHGAPVDHDQWMWKYGIQSYKERTGPIISRMREVHKLNNANIDTLIKRGERITVVAPKTVQLRENTQKFKKSSTTLKRTI